MAQRKFFVVAVKAHGAGTRKKEILEDMAQLTGGTFISEESGIPFDKITVNMLGQANKFICEKNRAVIMGGKGNNLEERITQLKNELEEAREGWDTEKLTERLANLTGGIGVIKVNAPSDIEYNELKHRVDDAVLATKSAVDSGIVEGGGMSLIRAMANLDINESLNEKADESTKKGINIVKKSLRSIFNQICQNCGEEAGEIIAKLGKDKGYSAADGKIVNMIEAGIIDPAKVITSALENAASVAGTFLTTDVAIAEIPYDRDEEKK